MERRIARDKLVLIHPYDDALVMAGQGTIALEMLEDHPDLDMIMIPLGGGGIGAGNAIAAKAIKPDIAIHGVEASLYPSFYNAIYHHTLPIGGATLAEGIAVKTVGRLTLPIVRSQFSSIALVSEDEIENAINCLATLAAYHGGRCWCGWYRCRAAAATKICREKGWHDFMWRQH